MMNVLERKAKPSGVNEETLDNRTSRHPVLNITIGTAGHIDHGKSALVHKLTGTHPDRFEEELVRGMTIDLGYAFYETRDGCRVGVIDVPGHEKFVRNMVPGAASIDIVMLVVAADDGVMPQTREHLEITKALGISKGLVALSKVDVVDKEMRELASQDIRELVEGTFLENCPIVPLSSHTGEGLEVFKDRLEELIRGVEHRSFSGLFRMPVQRAFSAKGFGTVVTGVPVSGSVRKGETVEFLPVGSKGRIRGLQAFGDAQVEGNAGHRLAINISDVDYRSVDRGCTVATPGFFKPCLFFEGVLHGFDDLDFPIKNMSYAKVHSGTAEEMGRIVLLDCAELGSGGTAYAQIRLESPMVVAPGDRFLLRRHSPPRSLGGGTVLCSTDRKARRFKDVLIESLRSRRDALKRGLPALAELDMRCGQTAGFFSILDVAVSVCQTEETVEELIQGLLDSGDVIKAERGMFIHMERYKTMAGAAESVLAELHRAAPLDPFVDTALLRGRLDLDQMEFQNFLKMMEKDGRIETSRGGLVRKAGYRIELDEIQLKLAEKIGSVLNDAGLSPPDMPELCRRLGAGSNEVELVCGHLVTTGVVRRVGVFFFSTEMLEKLEDAVVRCAREHGEVKIPLIRDAFSTTRKYLIPLMEYLDNRGVTRREGDRRFLAE